MLGDALALEKHGEIGPRPAVNERLPASEPRIEVIEIQRCPGGQIDELPPLKRQFSVAADRRNEVVAEGKHVLCRHGSMSIAAIPRSLTRALTAFRPWREYDCAGFMTSSARRGTHGWGVPRSR